MDCWECRDTMAGAPRPGLLPNAAAEHLARCRACRDFAEQLAAVEISLARWSSPASQKTAEAREALVARLTAAQAAASVCPPCRSARHWGARPAPLLAGTAAAVLLVLLGWAGGRWQPRRAERETPFPIAQGGRPDRKTHGPSSGTQRPAGAAARELRQAAHASDGMPVERQAPVTSLPRRRFAHSRGDLSDLNGGPVLGPRRWATPPADAWARVEARVRRQVPVRDDFVRILFPRVAAAFDREVVAAAESYKREAAVVDSRLSREVSLQQKAAALSDLCERLRADTGIALMAGSSVADEKVSIFCRKAPLREIMRQLSRPFGYAWVRSGKAGEYRYELAQDLRSQLLEEELRNRDRNEALLALEREIERYRPYLGFSPDEAQARAKSAAPVQKKLLENLAGLGWGPIQMYFRLAHRDLAALRAGQRLRFSTGEKPGEPALPLPPDLRIGVLQCNRGWHVVKQEHGFGLTPDLTDPRGVATTAMPEVHAQVTLEMVQSEPGVFIFGGQSGFFMARQFGTLDSHGPLATGMSPSVRNPENGAANARLARDPALRPRVSIQPQPSCGANPSPTRGGEQSQPKVSTADVLEALHRSAGIPIVSDYYTRLYKPAEVSVTGQPLFDALNHLADATRMRWNRDGAWLQLRSASYYNDRLKEVPNRLLERWATARQQHGALTLEDLVEIVQLSDEQLRGAEMAEGARLCYGLAEWDLATNGVKRRDLRFLVGFTPEQRQATLSAAGLPFTRMSLAQQQRYLSLAFGPDDEPLQSLEDLAGATLRVDYSLPGMFEWRVPGPPWLQWVVPVEPGPQGRRVPRPPVRERTREAALQALRQVDPAIRQAVLQTAARIDPRLVGAPPSEEAQIVPSRLDLAIIYIPGSSNRRAVRARFDYNDTDSMTTL